MFRLRIWNSREIFFFLNQALRLACDQTTDYLSLYQSRVELLQHRRCGDGPCGLRLMDCLCRHQNSAGQLENHTGHAGTQLLLEWSLGEVNSLL